LASLPTGHEAHDFTEVFRDEDQRSLLWVRTKALKPRCRSLFDSDVG
jgi:hypothetical protein